MTSRSSDTQYHAVFSDHRRRALKVIIKTKDLPCSWRGFRCNVEQMLSDREPPIAGMIRSPLACGLDGIDERPAEDLNPRAIGQDH